MNNQCVKISSRLPQFVENIKQIVSPFYLLLYNNNKCVWEIFHREKSLKVKFVTQAWDFRILLG